MGLGLSRWRLSHGGGKEEDERCWERGWKKGEEGEGEDGAVVEARLEAETKWLDFCDRLCAASLFKAAHLWGFGNNIDGKTVACRFYFADLSSYWMTVKDIVDGGWRGLKLFA